MAGIVVIGGGFAGMWSAIGAMRALTLYRAQDRIGVTLISKDPYLTVRPRLYEANPAEQEIPLRVPLDPVLSPIGVRRIEGAVTGIETAAKQVTVSTSSGTVSVPYDRLILAAGSQLFRPDVPGLREHAFSVDTYREALDLQKHLERLAAPPYRTGQFTAVVVGSGLTGIEAATEMVTRLRQVAAAAGQEPAVRVVVVDRNAELAPGLGAEARRVVVEAFGALGVEVRTGKAVASITDEGVTLEGGEFIPAATAVWTGGFRANPLTRLLSVPLDDLGRLPVDSALRVEGLPHVYAAGDVARAMVDEKRCALMTCQHAMPQGKIAGHNAAYDLLGRPLYRYEQRRYVTCVDLGEWGGLYTRGWDRAVIWRGKEGKHMKHTITRHFIYPPASGKADEILQAADIGSFYRLDQDRWGMTRWAEQMIPPAIGHFFFRLRTAWSGAYKTQKT